MLTKNKAHNLLENAKWIWAKTYEKKFPHWYTLRKDWDNDDFVDLVIFIRENGVKEKFYKKTYIYYYYNGYKYWTMGNPVSRTDKTKTYIINRARYDKANRYL